MTVLIGIVGAAFVFGLFTLLRPRDRAPGGCTGNCAACTRDSACESRRAEP